MHPERPLLSLATVAAHRPAHRYSGPLSNKTTLLGKTLQAGVAVAMACLGILVAGCTPTMPAPGEWTSFAEKKPQAAPGELPSSGTGSTCIRGDIVLATCTLKSGSASLCATPASLRVPPQVLYLLLAEGRASQRFELPITPETLSSNTDLAVLSTPLPGFEGTFEFIAALPSVGNGAQTEIEFHYEEPIAREGSPDVYLLTAAVEKVDCLQYSIDKSAIQAIVRGEK